MPYGMGPIIRQALIHASPWQRYLIGVAMVAGGVGLVLLGHVAGGVLSVAGLLLLWQMVHHRSLRSHTGKERSGHPGD